MDKGPELKEQYYVSPFTMQKTKTQSKLFGSTCALSGAPIYVNGGDFTKLFGCKITGTVRKTHGLKYELDSDIRGFSYPGTVNKCHDPIFTEGCASYAQIELSTAKVKAELYSSFGLKGKTDIPVVIENAVGDGHAILLTHESYPGNSATRFIKIL